MCLGFIVKSTDSGDKGPGLETRLCPCVTLDKSFCLCERVSPFSEVEVIVAMVGVLRGVSVIIHALGTAVVGSVSPKYWPWKEEKPSSLPAKCGFLGLF